MKTTSNADPREDINVVLERHDRELMAIPGVAGVYVGLKPDQKTKCLKVMLSRSEARKKIPRKLDGYSVLTEVAGEIRPFN